MTIETGNESGQAPRSVHIAALPVFACRTPARFARQIVGVSQSRDAIGRAVSDWDWEPCELQEAAQRVTRHGYDAARVTLSPRGPSDELAIRHQALRGEPVAVAVRALRRVALGSRAVRE